MARLPLRGPAADGVKVALTVQLAPAASVATQLPVAPNSVLGVAAAWVMVTGTVPLLVTTTGRAALVVPTVCVLKVMAVTLSAMLGVAMAAAVPLTVMVGLDAALDWIVKVALRVPAAAGVKLAPSVQVPPTATLTAAPTQLPVALNSAALAPALAIPVIVSGAPPLLVIVMLAGVDVAFVTATWVEAKVSAVALTAMVGALAAAGLAM